MGELLKWPEAIGEIGLNVDTYATPVAGSATDTRVLVAAEIGRDGKLLKAIGYEISDDKGKAVANTFDAPPIVSPMGDGRALYLASLPLAPGRYRVKVGVIDAAPTDPLRRVAIAEVNLASVPTGIYVVTIVLEGPGGEIPPNGLMLVECADPRGGPMKIQLALAIAVVSLTVADAGAQYRGRLPSGSYSRTCNNAAMIGSVLTAQCKDQNGVTIVTRLYVLDCFGDISNEYGELVCANRRLPPGSYSRTCTACTSEGSSLRCTCRDMKQNPIKTALDLAGCQWNSGITNKDGHLQCE